jgi:hypothetical protein
MTLLLSGVTAASTGRQPTFTVAVNLLEAVLMTETVSAPALVM